MTLSKRERVFKALELDGEPDMVPINYFGFEQTGSSFQAFKKSGESDKYHTYVEDKVANIKYYITEQRFWNVDLFGMDPFGETKIKIRYENAPPEYPNCRLNRMDGRMYRSGKQVNTGLEYAWYVDGYFKTPEILHEYWDRYGKPTDLINNRIKYSSQIWERFVEALSPYFYPYANLPINPSEALIGGITFTRFAYYIRKNPSFIHEVMDEYTKVNIEIIKRLAEVGVDIVMFGDDLGYKDNPFFSLDVFHKFILPYHKRIYQICRKNGVIIILHSCGKIDQFLPDLADAGLNCIQSLEATAGVDLPSLKESLGDRLCFMGGLDSSGVLTYGTPKDVEENVKYTIKNAGKGGGYFVGPSHDIINIPWDNIMAMRAAIEKYRKYPLSF
ncbi:MAG: uroporphyrinogen decarboxylase family protein [Candidatus Hermodarchaeota archaeon]